jgi:hypothetical protein
LPLHRLSAAADTPVAEEEKNLNPKRNVRVMICSVLFLALSAMIVVDDVFADGGKRGRSGRSNASGQQRSQNQSTGNRRNGMPSLGGNQRQSSAMRDRNDDVDDRDDDRDFDDDHEDDDLDDDGIDDDFDDDVRRQRGGNPLQMQAAIQQQLVQRAVAQQQAEVQQKMQAKAAKHQARVDRLRVKNAEKSAERAARIAEAKARASRSTAEE